MRAIATSVTTVTGQCRTCGAMMTVDLRPVEDVRGAHVVMPTGGGYARYFQIDYLTSELRYNPAQERLIHYAKCAAPPRYCGGNVALIGGFAPVEHDDSQTQDSSLLLKDVTIERSA